MKLKDVSREYMEEWANAAHSDFWDALREDLDPGEWAIITKLGPNESLIISRASYDRITVGRTYTKGNFTSVSPLFSVSVEIFRPWIPMDELMEFLGDLEFEDIQYNVISWIYMYLKVKAVKIEAYV